MTPCRTPPAVQPKACAEPDAGRCAVVRWLRALPLLAMLAGCHSIVPYLDHYAETTPSRYVIVTPEGRDRLPCVQAMIAAREQQGLAVVTITFDPLAPAPERIRFVAQQLDHHRPADGELAYALLLATGEELPPGPWQVAGLERTIESDLPLLLGHQERDETIDEASWSRAFASPFPWIAGRIPFADEASIALALQPWPEREANAAAPLAMLGAERFAVWWDTSIIMSRARRQLQSRGWRTITYGEDWPCDFELGLTGLDDLHRQHRQIGLDSGPEDPRLQFVAHWAHLAPDVVYLNSHGSDIFVTTVGDYLLSAARIDQLGDHCKRGDGRARPSYPATVVIAACRAGGADSELTAQLFRDGWAKAIVASMETTSPTPLWVAIGAEIDTAAALASALPIGLAMRAVQQSYYEDACSSWSYWLWDSTAPTVANNLLALTLYGDPARPITGR